MHDPINKINLDNSNTGYTLGPATCHWVQQQISWIHFFKLIIPFVYISYDIPLPGYPFHQPPGFIFIEEKISFVSFVICCLSLRTWLWKWNLAFHFRPNYVCLKISSEAPFPESGQPSVTETRKKNNIIKIKGIIYLLSFISRQISYLCSLKTKSMVTVDLSILYGDCLVFCCCLQGLPGNLTTPIVGCMQMLYVQLGFNFLLLR